MSEIELATLKIVAAVYFVGGASARDKFMSWVFTALAVGSFVAVIIVRLLKIGA